MRFGVRVPVDGPLAHPEEITTLAKLAEDLGFDVLEVPDHIVIPVKIESKYPYSETGEAKFAGGGFEQLTTLAFLAGKTKKIRLMTSVMVVPHRDPLLAAKMLATLDNLSGGRLAVGVGVGWMREEFEALGLPDFDKRGSLADEYIRIFKEVWTNEDPHFKGKYSSFSGIELLPKPVQKPHPPLWVGGESPIAMRRAAKLGNYWYPLDSNPKFPLKNIAQLRDARDRLALFARSSNRRPEEIGIGYGARSYELTHRSTQDEFFVGDTDKIASDIGACEKLGISYLAFNLIGQTLDDSIGKMKEFAEEILPNSR